MIQRFDSERATFDSFLERWKELIPISPTIREAYERTEDEHLEIYGCRRFAEFSSFARARRNHLAKGHRPIRPR